MPMNAPASKYALPLGTAGIPSDVRASGHADTLVTSGTLGQSRLPGCLAWCGRCGLKGLVATLLLICVGCFLTGGMVFVSSRNVRHIEVMYDDGLRGGGDTKWCAEPCSADDKNRARQRVPYGTTRTILFHVEEHMPGPIYLYYMLERFYQNGRVYVRSRSDEQLAGTDRLLASGDYTWSTSSRMDDPKVLAAFQTCKPLRLANGVPSQSCKWNTSNAAAINAQQLSFNNSNQKESLKNAMRAPPCKILWPCGLVAGSFFNDVYSSTSLNASWSEEGIAWASDTRGHGGRFANPTVETAGWDYRSEVAKGPSSFYYMLHQQYPNFPRLEEEGVENEHFIVWMRTAAMPTLRNLYAILHVDQLSVGDIVEVQVASRYDVSEFQGTKSIILTSGGSIGRSGGHVIVGGIAACIFFFVIGVISGSAGITLWILHLQKDRYVFIDGKRSKYIWNNGDFLKED